MGDRRGGPPERRHWWADCRRIKKNGGNKSTITNTPEVGDLKARLKDTWMAGDYDRFSRYMEQGARMFYERLDVPAGCQLLDVACGSGQGGPGGGAGGGWREPGVDIAPNRVQRPKPRPDAEGLRARFMKVTPRLFRLKT